MRTVYFKGVEYTDFTDAIVDVKSYFDAGYEFTVQVSDDYTGDVEVMTAEDFLETYN